MKRLGSWPRGMACVLTAAALAGSSGCFCCMTSLSPVSPDAAARNAAMPQVSRNHVHIFLINGEYPLDLANLDGMRDALISLGYIKTYRGEWYHCGYFKDEILRLRREDESARFVVMGFSQGVNAARDLTDAVGREGATIDLLVYCGDDALAKRPKYRPGRPKYRPENAVRVVRLLPEGSGAGGAAAEGADAVFWTDQDGYGSPTYRCTTEVLARELNEVASSVQVIDQRPPVEPTPEMGPAPRAAAERETMPRDDWDFLKPTLPYPRVLSKPAGPDMPKAP